MNARFSEYVTSGAFNMTLTRAQISQLGLLAAEPGSGWSLGSLERKGLVEPIASPHSEDRVEWRITGAGAICLSLLFEAGLTNAGKDSLAAEIDSLRQALDAANQTVREVRQKTRSMHAKLKDAEVLNENLVKRLAALKSELDAERVGVRLKAEFSNHGPVDYKPMVRLRDPLPDVAAADLVEDDPETSTTPERTPSP